MKRDPDSTTAAGGPQVRIAPDIYARLLRWAGRLQADASRPAGRVTLQDTMRDLLDRAERESDTEVEIAAAAALGRMNRSKR